MSSRLLILRYRRETCIRLVEKNQKNIKQLLITCEKVCFDRDVLKKNLVDVVEHSPFWYSTMVSIEEHHHSHIEILKQLDECQLTIQLLDNERLSIQKELRDTYCEYHEDYPSLESE